ncbi:MAG: hypothetical protein N2320_06475 [Candidatus Bipolaricaulota bacterium]|nr:hypothetical protein [Candidatus Bipolaricaulota bacterium]
MERAYTLDLVPPGEPHAARIHWRDGRAAELPLVPLPDPLWEWQLRTRIANLNFFLTGGGEHDFAVHTGYMATVGTPEAFPLGLAAKGIGLLPRGELAPLTAEIEGLVARALAEGEKGTREERLRFLVRLYEEVPLDRRVLTTIELYGKGTWRNVLGDPRCAVLFSSYRGTSYAVDGVVEIHPPGDPVYRYVVALHDLFHPPRGGRREFPAVYRIWAAEVWDKTPGPRAGSRLA